jgi:hypothetical protein
MRRHQWEQMTGQRSFGNVVKLRHNGSHHPARASEATMSKTADRVLGVHGLVIPCISNYKEA